MLLNGSGPQLHPGNKAILSGEKTGPVFRGRISGKTSHRGAFVRIPILTFALDATEEQCFSCLSGVVHFGMDSKVSFFSSLIKV